MRFSEAWLREWANPKIAGKELIAQLTLLGLEVETRVAAAAEFSKVCVARVEALAPHPDADKLRICDVNNGSETLKIVCGAPNVYVGMRVAFAQIGAVLPGGMKIKAAKLRGVASQGMLCSEKELGLSDQSSGLMELHGKVKLGMDLRDFLALEDHIIEIDLTPNRGDCFSIRGLSRDLAARTSVAYKHPSYAAVPAEIETSLAIKLVDAEACPRYLGRVIKNINAKAKSPQWLVEKLRRSGLRAISPVVDVTNYVLMELGQPLHAFDYDCLDKAGVQVRQAKKDEKLTLLDGSEHTLTKGTLVIADAKKALALAGVMGGLDSSVTDDTKNIFLECAYFSPLAIVGKARSYGLATDAAQRYERGVDPQLQTMGIERATALLLDIAGGEAGPVTEAVVEKHIPQHKEIELRGSQIKRLLGIAFAAKEVKQILTALGLVLISESEGVTRWQAPSWRFDLQIEADLIEELGRMRGYDAIPRTFAAIAPQISKPTPLTKRINMAKLLVERGYQEVITYSFVDQELQEVFNLDGPMLALANPISSELGVMRTNLWPGLLTSLQRNLNRQQHRVRLFETGMVFQQRDNAELLQENHIAGLMTGQASAEQWGSKPRTVDFYDLKGDVEAILGLTNIETPRFEAEEHPALHPGQSARIYDGKQAIGWLGRLHPGLLEALDLPQETLLFELSLAQLNSQSVAKFSEISRFPSIRRDIAVVVDDSVTSQALYDVVVNSCPNSLKELLLFDVYALGSGRKSVALGLILQELSRTLTENEVDEIQAKVLGSLDKKLGATLRVS